MKNILIAAACSLFSLVVSAQTYRGSAVRQTAEQKLNNLYCSGMFRSAEGTILEVADNISSRGYFNILDWLEGRVAGLQIYNSGNGISYPLIRGNVPGVYLDEIPVQLSILNSISVNDIAIVKIIKTPFYGGFNGGGGAIAIYTLGGKEDSTEL